MSSGTLADTPAVNSPNRVVRTSSLEIACEAIGPEDGFPVVLLHGFPDAPRAYDGAIGSLAALGFRILVPWLRGFEPTRFLTMPRRVPASRPPWAATCWPS